MTSWDTDPLQVDLAKSSHASILLPNVIPPPPNNLRLPINLRTAPQRPPEVPPLPHAQNTLLISRIQVFLF